MTLPIPLQALSDLGPRLAQDPAAADPLLACGLFQPHTVLLADLMDRPRETLFSMGLSARPEWVRRMQDAIQDDPDRAQRWQEHLTGMGHAMPLDNPVLRAFRHGWWATGTALLDSLEWAGLTREQVMPRTGLFLEALAIHHAADPARFTQAVSWLARNRVLNGEAEWARAQKWPGSKTTQPLLGWLVETRPWAYVDAAWKAGARPVDEQGQPLLWRWYAAWCLDPGARIDAIEQTRRVATLVRLTLTDPERWETSWEAFPGKQMVGMWDAMDDEDKAVARAALKGPAAQRRLPLGWLLRATHTPMGAVLGAFQEEKVLRESLQEMAPAVVTAPSSVSRRRL